MAEPRPGDDELKQALRACAPALGGVALLSSLVNILMLTGSVFMLEVYDRVLPSRSVPTLVVLAVVVTMLYAFQGLFDVIRSRVLVRVGAAIHERLAGRAFRATLAMPLSAGPGSAALQPLRELDTIRGFLAGQGPSALADLPWMPIYLGVCFLFHPAIGWTATAGAALLVAMTALTEFASREPIGQAAAEGGRQQALADAARRNAEAARAMGLAPRLEARWRILHDRHLSAGARAADVVGGIGAASKVLRMVLQSAVLGVGAWLVVHGEATGGIMIASSILTSRALAPVELAVANWRGFVAARRSVGRLRDVLSASPAERERLMLPKPSWGLAVEGVSVAPPGAARLVVQDIAFQLAAGDGLAIVGPSGSGKSSLARLLVGVWQPARGKVRLDGAALAQWPAELLGASVGYIPQTVELFAGSVADNIRRFDADGSDDEVVAAARTAGAHDLILRLPEGYATEIGDGGSLLSAGQRQRVALARALFRDPFLVVLDEPNSNLDADGEAALTEALRAVRRRGGIAVVIAHRPSALAALDTVLVMADGRAQAFGPKERVLGGMRPNPPQAAAQPELKVVADREGRA